MNVWRVVLAITLTLLARFLFLPETVQADVLTVAPGESINAAIAQAQEGDTVLVMPGSYQEAVRLKGGVLLRGQGGAGAVHLVGLPDEAVITATGPGTRTLDGFTLDGDYRASAGVAVNLFGEGGLAITNCRIVEVLGPGIQAELTGAFAHLAVAHNIVAGNTGGGLRIDADLSTVFAFGNEVVENAGGGCSVFAADGAAVHLDGNLIEANQGSVGAGIAAIAAEGGRVIVAGNRVAGNTGELGGGIAGVASGGSLVLVNNDVHENRAFEHGGLSLAVRYEGTLSCTQNTVAKNEATDVGVGIDASSGSEVRVANNIFWGNSWVDYEGPDADHSVIGTGRTGGTGNLSVDPRFFNPAAGDYRLTPVSPCVDRGDNNALPANVTTDAAGASRLRGAAVDPGCYEFATARQLVADLRAEVSERVQAGEITSRTASYLDQRLRMADYYLSRRARGGNTWALFYLRSFLDLVRDQSGITIQPDAATGLQSAGRAIYSQVERWGA